MFSKISKKSAFFRNRPATILSGLGYLSLKDTLECGQAFRYEKLAEEENYLEYMTVAYGKIIRVGQEKPGELIFFDKWDEEYEECISRYFALDLDFEEIRHDIISKTDSEWLISASDAARGIAILRQDPWEALFSFIVSQNNNIPRIRKIIKTISSQYGENLAIKYGYESCPLPKNNFAPCKEKCSECGICFSFPTPNQVLENPDGLLPSHPGFRYKYLVDAAEKVASGEVNLQQIAEKRSYVYTIEQLKRILGVGDKVASCVALFGFSNLEAFPIDVWMKRAIDLYFGGKLDPASLGKYAGVAQQYIFHYIRNLEEKDG